MVKIRVRFGLAGVIVLALLLGACAPSDSSSTSTPTVNATAPSEGAEAAPEDSEAIAGGSEPVLSNVLIRDCKRSGPSDGFENAGLATGETAIGFTLKDVYGNTVSLAGLLSEKPVVMIFGSFT